MNTLPSLIRPDRRKGSATLVVLSLLSIMVILETVEFAAARHLDSELRLIERRQLQRLNRPPPKQSAAAHDNPTHG
jgi:hypothetical protein